MLPGYLTGLLNKLQIVLYFTIELNVGELYHFIEQSLKVLRIYIILVSHLLYS